MYILSKEQYVAMINVVCDSAMKHDILGGVKLAEIVFSLMSVQESTKADIMNKFDLVENDKKVVKKVVKKEDK